MTTEEAAGSFIREMEHVLLIIWWTSLSLTDCGMLVYKHGVHGCACGRSQSEAYEAWCAQNPEAAAEHVRRLKGEA